MEDRDDRNAVILKSGLGQSVTDIGIVLIISCIMTVIALATKSLWGDEVLSLQFASQDFKGLFNNLAQDYHPPLYFILMKIWITFFGSSEIVLRIFQGIQGCFFLLLALLLFRKIIPSRRYHPFWIVLATSSELWLFVPMIRYYTLSASFVLLSTILFFRWLEVRDTKSSLLLTLSYVLILYTDYPASVIIPFHLIHVLFKQKHDFRKLLAVDGIAIALFLPWIMVVLIQMAKLINIHHFADLNTSPFVILLKISYSLYAFALGEMIFPFEIISIVILLLIVIVVVLSIVKFKLFQNDSVLFLLYLVMSGVLFTSIITTYISTHTSFIYTPARTFFALPFFLMLFGILYSKISNSVIKYILISSFVLANIYGIGNWMLNRHFMMPVYATPWKAVINDLEGEQGIVIADENLCYSYYYDRIGGILPAPQSTMSVQDLSHEINERSSKNVFLILTGRESSETEVNQEIIDYLKTTGRKVYEKKYLIIDESYRKIKLKILGRDNYDAKITLIKYIL